MVKDKQVRCMCNSTYCGEVCPHCGMPGATARFFFSDNGKTGVGFALIFFACVGFCFGYNYLAIKAPFSENVEIADSGNGNSGPLFLDTIPHWGSEGTPLDLSDPVKDQNKKAVVSPPAPTVEPIPAVPVTKTPPNQESHHSSTVEEKPTKTERHQQKSAKESNNEAQNNKSRRLKTGSRSVPIKSESPTKTETDAEKKQSISEQEQAPAVSTTSTGRKPTKPSVTDAESLIEPLLHILVGTQDSRHLINTHFSEKVVEPEIGLQFDRDELRDRLEEYNANYPFRAIKIISAGISGLRLELNTLRIFQDVEGERIIRYGQTHVLIGQDGIIEGFTDSSCGAECPLSPGFTPINYKGKKLISHKTK